MNRFRAPNTQTARQLDPFYSRDRAQGLRSRTLRELLQSGGSTVRRAFASGIVTWLGSRAF